MTLPDPRPRRNLPRALVLAGLVLALHAGSLRGPLRDGQGGNCAAMFALMARNANRIGWLATRGVPIINPVPPAEGAPLEVYAHHPPGLPWLVTLASSLPLDLHTSERLVALALWLLSVLLAADLASRLACPAAGWAAGLVLACLPAGVLHGLLVNYESVALPCVLGLTRSLLLGVGRPALWALAAALADWVALLPLALAAAWAPRRRTLPAFALALLAGLAALLHGRLLASSSAGETLNQALAATFLGGDFRWSAWGQAWWRDAGTLFGLAGPLSLLAFIGAPPARRRVLLVLLGSGLLNVVLFAHHASSHEHFWLLFAPFVAVASGCLAFPHARRRRAPGLLVIAALLAAGWVAAWGEPARRSSTRQATLARAFAAVSDERSVFVTPSGVPLVFLEGASRHVCPLSTGSLAQARDAAAAYASRFGLAALPVQAFLSADLPPPAWLAALGQGELRAGFRFWEVPSAPGASGR